MWVSTGPLLLDASMAASMRARAASKACSVDAICAIRRSPSMPAGSSAGGHTALGAFRPAGNNPRRQTVNCCTRCTSVGCVCKGRPFRKRFSIPAVVNRQVAHRCSTTCCALQQSARPSGCRDTASLEAPVSGADNSARVRSSSVCMWACCLQRSVLVKVGSSRWARQAGVGTSVHSLNKPRAFPT